MIFVPVGFTAQHKIMEIFHKFTYFYLSKINKNEIVTSIILRVINKVGNSWYTIRIDRHILFDKIQLPGHLKILQFFQNMPI